MSERWIKVDYLREKLICSALSGIVAGGLNPISAAQEAIEYADAMIAELKNEQGETDVEEEGRETRSEDRRGDPGSDAGS